MAAPHQAGELLLAERPVHRQPRFQIPGQFKALQSLLTKPRSGQMQVCNSAVKALENPQQPVDSLGMTQFAGVEQLHRPCRWFVTEGEQPIIETGTDDRYPAPIHRIQAGYPFCLVCAQRQDTVYPTTVSQHPVTELRTLDKLPQFGRVAGGNHRQAWQNLPRDSAHQPEMMAVDDINGNRLGHLPDNPCKYLFILKYRFRREIAETGTGIGHNIAHPWYGKIEIASGEADETTALCIDSLKLGYQSG